MGANGSEQEARSEGKKIENWFLVPAWSFCQLPNALIRMCRDFPGSPVVRTLVLSLPGPGFNP